MNIVEFISNWWKEALEYKERVLKDGGTTKREDIVQQYNQMCKQNGIFDSIKFAWSGEAGGKLRTSGANQFWTKAYSLVTPTDATQTTSTSQPHISGNIAPTERLGMKNPNGGSNYMTHPTISFAANEAWSLSLNFMPFGSNTGTTSRICGNDTASKTRIELAPNGGTLYVYGETANAGVAIPNRKGKNTNLNLLYDGAGNVDVIIEKTLIGTIVVNSAFTFNTIGRASGGQYFYGIINSIALRSGKLTPFQYNPESNFFSTRYNQIPNVTIGSQVWATSNCEMVCTPMGNLITNVTANATWVDSTNIYNTTYAATSGTDEQKTYAAVKAAAMWCYYNNDPALGAVYGKLLNDYAIKLLDMDIAYYNTANPTTSWGWGISTEADWNILETTINNDAEALKHAGTTYWTAPNAGTNSSGFTALPAGYRKEDGTFAGLGTTALFGSTDMSVPRIGKSLRLIKR